MRETSPDASALAHRWGAAWVTVTCEVPDLLPDLRRLFPTLHVPATHRSGATPTVRVTRDDAGYRVAGRGGTTTCHDASMACEAVEWAIAQALLRVVSDRVHLHAGGAVIGDAALLVLGPGGAGKSSIAFAWHRAGLPVLGDDVVLVESDGRAAAFPRLFKLPPPVLVASGVPLASTPSWREGVSEAWYDPGPGGWAPSPARVALIAVARHGANGPPRVRDLSRTCALAALMESAMSSGQTGAAALDALLTLAREARVREIAFAEPARAAAALRALVS